MATYQIAHAVVDDAGELLSGQGVTGTTWEATGHYAFAFEGGGFAAPPAVVLTGHPEEAVYPRLNFYSGTENRQKDVKVDAYDLASGKFKETNTGFHALAICQNSAPNSSLGTEASLKIVAGILGPNAAVDTSYGGFSVSDTSSVGSYILTFTEAFAEPPTVVATVEQTAEGVLTAHIDDATVSGLEIVLRDGTRTQVNGTVHFIAVGKPKEGATAGTHRFVCGVVHRDAQFDDTPILAGEGFTPTVNAKGDAHFTLSLTTPFQSKPVVVACAEHMKDPHLRQLQVHPPTATDGAYGTLKLDVYGKDKKRSGFNNSHFHFIAYAPK